MAQSSDDLLRRHADLLLIETNDVLRKGAFVCIVLGYSASAAILVMIYSGMLRDFTIPTLWALSGGTISVAVYVLARNRLIRGWVEYLVVIFFVLMPTALFIVSHFLLPSGTATYVTGPASYIYFFFIVLTGFLFNTRLSFFGGALSAVFYTLAVWVDRRHLADLSHPDPILLQDFASFPIYVFKGQMMLFAGIAMGFLAKTAKKILNDVLREEDEKRTIDRLFGQYVSPEVKTLLLSRKHAGEKRSVAVLFSDIRSFSTISESLAPEDIVLQLNQYLDRMVQCIQSNGGVVDKFIGDAIMATFGGLLDLPNPCASAVKAALAMQEEVSRLNRRWWEEGRPPFAIGIGIHYGEVLQGEIGSEFKKEYTVIGDAVNTASRIESLTKKHPYPVLFSDDVARHLPPEAASGMTDLGEVEVAGRLKTVRIFGIKP